MTEPRILSTPGKRFPPGPSLVSRFLAGDLFRGNPLPNITADARRYGDLFHFRAFGRDIFQCSHPDLVAEMLVTHAPLHHRGVVMQKARLVLGDGMLSSEDPHHLRQRRLAQPAFHRDRIAAYGATIGRYAGEMVAGWGSGGTRDLQQDMQLLTLRIVGKTMFDEELADNNRRIAHAIGAFMAFLPLAFLPMSDRLYKTPLPMMRRIRGARRELDHLIYGLIRERRAEGVDHGDLLSMLLASQDAEGTGSMTDEQVRDECVTALLAGNETTANALSFACWLVAAHPDVQQRLRDEATSVLRGEPATAAHYGALPYARACFAETMRLYPPVWTIARTAAKSYEWRGMTIPQGSVLIAPQWVVHRDPRFWEEPEAFRPQRFLEEEAARERPKFAYFPFGAGNRQCIGEGLAWMEGVLILATIAEAFAMQQPMGAAASLPLDPKITLRPKGGVPVVVRRIVR